MKKIFLLVYFVAFNYVCVYSQDTKGSSQYEIIYSLKNGVSDVIWAFKGSYANKMSKYISLGKLKNLDENFKGKSIEERNVNLFKNFKENSILYNEFLLGKTILTKDSLDVFKWELITEETKILNYICNVATTSFRGRTYKAYYTTEIPLPNGPWKFSGLPGLILKVESLDGDYTYEAISIKTQTESLNNLELDYQNMIKKKFIFWPEFKILFKEKFDEHIRFEKSNKTEEESKYPDYLKITRPEIIYKELQTGQGLAF